ncbi:hypothetical protein [Streptomyces sp. NRRL S-1813]|uniref:hypothetical protein n=1 Tax=Streptomyces sp. NRRL S-1813 TaxID=1463888 RepID=UPI003B6326E8
MIGTDLTGATAVTFGGSPGNDIVVDPSGCSLTVACPPKRAGSCDVCSSTVC